MTRRLRQTTRGITVKKRVGAARTTPLCLWSIRERVQKLCWNLGPQFPRPGTPGVGSTTRIRTRGFGLGSSLLVGGNTRKPALNGARKMVKNRRYQPVGSLVGHLGLQCPLLGTPVLVSLGLQCPLAGTSGLGSIMRVQTRGFSPRVLLIRWRKLVRSRPHCTRNVVQHRRCQPVGSLVGHLGLQYPPLGTPFFRTSGL